MSGVSLRDTNNPEGALISLIIPCYNEEGNIHKLLEKTSALLAKEPRCEVIYVNNGSTDSTKFLLEEMTHSLARTRLVNIEKNIGYGHGIKKGLEVSKGSIVGWTHADLQTNPLDALRGLEAAGDFSEKILIKGLRKKRPLVDSAFTFGMTIFESALFRTNLRDINAQPTLFSRDLLKTVLEGPDDFSLDLYTMVRASEAGYKKIRFPVEFARRFRGFSKWNTSTLARLKFIKRTVVFSFALAKRGRPS
jgi:glycosyltransferase involved in cell wall biosynthesis